MLLSLLLKEAHENNFWVITSGMTAHEIAVALSAAAPDRFHHVAKGKQAAAFAELTPAQRETFRRRLAALRNNSVD